MTKLTDPVRNETAWTFDILDRVTQETNELSQSRYFACDTAGNLTWWTDGLGRVIEFVYHGRWIYLSSSSAIRMYRERSWPWIF